MSSLEARKEYIVEKVAGMIVFGATAETIMNACALSAEDLERLQTWPEYTQKLSEMQDMQFEQQRAIEQGWDFLEYKALQNLSSVVEYNKDPTLNLAVARAANSATRTHKGNRANQPINPDGLAKTVVVHLGINFVNEIQRREINKRDDGKVIDHKDVDCLPQGQVENFFGISRRELIEDAAEDFVQEFA